MNSLKSVAAALEIDMHNLERIPRTQLLGVRLGYAGVAIGTLSAIAAILADFMSGAGTAFDVGVGMGLVGLIAGTSCAFIGFVVDRNSRV